MKFLFVFIFLIISEFCKSQCFSQLSSELDKLEKIPYSLMDKRVYDIESGKTYCIKLSRIPYRTKLGFLIQTDGVSDSIDVTLTTLNRKILAKKLITNKDCILRHEPFKKTENYFLLIKIHFSKEKQKGCLGLLILERITKRPLGRVQKIRWKFEETLEKPN